MSAEDESKEVTPPPEEPSGHRETDPAKLLPEHAEPHGDFRVPGERETDPAKLLPAHSATYGEKHDHKYPPHHPAHRARYSARWMAGILTLVAMYAGGMAIHDKAQERTRNEDRARRMTGGEPARGPALMRTYGCAQCHTVPGVPGANGLVGPPLTGIAGRFYLGGVVTNTPDNMVRWIMNPKAIDAKTAMPSTGVTEEQARHIAAYLYTLQ